MAPDAGAVGPDTGKDNPYRALPKAIPVTHPARCLPTTVGASAIRCPDPTTGKSPALAGYFSSRCLRGWRAAVHSKRRPTAIVATTNKPPSKRPTGADDAN